MTKLTQDQLATLKTAIQHRATKFPRSVLQAKLQAADTCYHLATARSDLAESDPNKQQDTYSRFQELDDAVVREVAEAYHSYYSSTYLSGAKIFSMTSGTEKKEQAQKYNLILLDQQQRTSWGANLSNFFLDCAKYNLGAVDTFWKSVPSYQLKIDITAANDQVDLSEVTWRGNAIESVDMYNCIFDHTITPNRICEEGEFAGRIFHMTQTRLHQLVQNLKLDPEMTVYDKLDSTMYPHGTTIYELEDSAIGHGLHYYNVELETLGTKGQNMNEAVGSSINWATEFGIGQHELNRQYQVAKIYLRVIPSAYKFPATTKEDQQEIWEIWMLGGNFILATKRLSNAHGYIPMVFGQPDADSLKFNSAGPAQVAIPYQKTAKQMLDRILAGADRAIRDRALFDPRYIDADAINSAIPDAKIPVKSDAMASTKTLDSVYKSIEFNGDTTGISQHLDKVKLYAQRAAGINNSMAGQFTKGNKTLEEYNDVQANAAGKQFLRALMLETTAITRIKRILKLNIIQYQEDTSLYDPQTETRLKISRGELYKADVEFKLADALQPTEHMISPNVMQQVFALIGQNPQAFQEYNLADMTVFIIQQSLGFDLSQFKLQQQAPQA